MYKFMYLCVLCKGMFIHVIHGCVYTLYGFVRLILNGCVYNLYGLPDWFHCSTPKYHMVSISELDSCKHQCTPWLGWVQSPFASNPYWMVKKFWSNGKSKSPASGLRTAWSNLLVNECSLLCDGSKLSHIFPTSMKHDLHLKKNMPFNARIIHGHNRNMYACTRIHSIALAAWSIQHTKINGSWQGEKEKEKIALPSKQKRQCIPTHTKNIYRHIKAICVWVYPKFFGS